MKEMIYMLILQLGSAGVGWSAETTNVVSHTDAPVTPAGREWFPMGGVKYDSVTGPTAAGCLCWEIRHPERHICSHDFWIAQIEAGRGGGKIQAGAGFWYMFGGMAKLSLLRSWGDPLSDTEPNQTYLGAEVEVNFLQINSTLGVYGRVQGAGEGRGTMLTWSVGIGF